MKSLFGNGRLKISLPIIRHWALFTSCAGLLMGCGSGGGETSSSVPASHAIKETITIYNNLSDPIRSFSIANHHGETIATYPLTQECAGHSACTSLTINYIPQRHRTVKFYDAKHRLVAAHLFRKATEGGKTLVFAHADITGAYLIGRLITLSNTSSNATVLADLRRFLRQPADKRSDNSAIDSSIFSAVYTYYQYYKGTDNSNDIEAVFLNDTLAKLRSKEVLPPDYLTALPLKQWNPSHMATLKADLSLCAGTTILSNAVGYFDKVANFLPIPSAWVGIARKVSDTYNNVCNVANTVSNFLDPDSSSPAPIGPTLTDIQQTLAVIQAQLTAMSYTEDVILNAVATNGLYSSLSSMDNTLTAADIIINNYLTLLNSTGGSSLYAVVQANGGLTAVRNGDFPVINDLLSKQSLANMAQQLTALGNSSTLTQIQNNLTTLCATPTSIPGDTVTQRNLCNSIVLTYSSRIAAKMSTLGTIAIDLAQTINTSSESRNYSNPWSESWPTAIAVIRQKSDVGTLVVPYLATSGSIYPPTDGLPQSLIDALAKTDCTDPAGIESSGIMGILSWSANANLPNTANGLSASQYITTSCNPSGQQYVPSQFYYNLDGWNYGLVDVGGQVVPNGINQQIPNATGSKTTPPSGDTWTISYNSSDYCAIFCSQKYLLVSSGLLEFFIGSNNDLVSTSFLSANMFSYNSTSNWNSTAPVKESDHVLELYNAYGSGSYMKNWVPISYPSTWLFGLLFNTSTDGCAFMPGATRCLYSALPVLKATEVQNVGMMTTSQHFNPTWLAGSVALTFNIQGQFYSVGLRIRSDQYWQQNSLGTARQIQTETVSLYCLSNSCTKSAYGPYSNSTVQLANGAKISLAIPRGDRSNQMLLTLIQP